MGMWSVFVVISIYNSDTRRSSTQRKRKSKAAVNKGVDRSII